MPLLHDLVRLAGTRHIRRGHTIDKKRDKEYLQKHFTKLGHDKNRVLDSLKAIAPECLCMVRGVWWMTMIHPTKLCVYEDRIVLIRRLLWFRNYFRCERAVMMRHIREVENDLNIFSANLIFRTHRSVEVFRARKIYKKGSRQATRIIQALIHEELNHGSPKSGDDLT